MRYVDHDFASPFKHSILTCLSTQEDVNSPVKRPIVHAARPDAVTHFEMSDQSPAPAPGQKANTQSAAAPNKPRNARSDMRSHWDFGGDGGEEMPIGKIYKTAGNGMGGRLGARSWGIGDDSDPEVEDSKKTRGGRGGRKDQQRAEELDF
jgi:hypothetical protein